jgi:anti-sigma B factor antagonist
MHRVVNAVDNGSRYVRRFGDQVLETIADDQEPPLEIRVSSRPGGKRVVEPTGDVDMLTAPALDRVVAENLAARPQVLILDLSGVTFLASTGLASLVSAMEGCDATGAALRLVGTGPRVLRPMELTGLITLFDVYPDLESALRGGEANS